MLNRKSWSWYLLAVILSFALWFRLTYPQLAFIDLSIDQRSALELAKTYLQEERGVDIRPYRTAVVFTPSNSPDVYLQKALGFIGELDFLKKHDFELFFWKARFFKERQKEEYIVLLSAATGQITDCVHVIEESAARNDEGKIPSYQRVIGFLQQRFSFTLDRDYVVHGETTRKHDKRTDYGFVWKHKDVFIPWSRDPSQGGAKLLTAAMASGNEILSFYKYKLDIPDQFKRHLEEKRAVGNNFHVLFRSLFLGLLITAVFLVTSRRNNLVLHNTKKFAIAIAGLIFLCDVLSYINHFSYVLYGYNTSITFASYLWQSLSNFLLDAFMSCAGILLPCLAAEALHHEVFPQKERGRFLHYLNSTFLSRDVARLIVLGYLGAVIMFGIQSVAFALGQKYLGVWVEHTWLATLSANTFPLVAALCIGITASVSEEIFFRIFGISLGKKLFKNTLIAVLISSLVWGYGHSSYPVFPMWFRGLEVTCLGLFLSFIYLRYGIIPVLVAHFVFDVVWYSSAYLFGKTSLYNFLCALLVVLLPLFWAFIAYLANRPEHERPLRWRLNRHQLYNLTILKNFLRDPRTPRPASAQLLKEEIISHGWDPAVVDIALDDIKTEPYQKPDASARGNMF